MIPSLDYTYFDRVRLRAAGDAGLQLKVPGPLRLGGNTAVAGRLRRLLE